MASEEKTSESGDPIYIYSEEDRRSNPAVLTPDYLELIDAHIERYVGKPETVFHELASELVHIDVHWVKPSSRRNAHTLITSGMSDLPMEPPAGAKHFKYSELFLTLPPEWELSENAFRDEKNYWPIRLLKGLARFPHEFGAWLWRAHTVPNGNPPEPFDPSTKFTSAILTPAISLPLEFLTLECSPEKTIYFFAVVPLYTEEMDLKLKKGADFLFNLFDKKGIDDVINNDRVNVAKNKWFHLW